MADQLTPMQRLFVAHYLKDPNATQAAKLAGYSEDTARSIGSENLSKPAIAAAIAKGQAKRAKRLEIDADYVLLTIQDTIEECRQDGEHGAALKGCELLGKHLKLFAERIEHANPDGSAIQFTDHEAAAKLAAILNAARARKEAEQTPAELVEPPAKLEEPTP